MASPQSVVMCDDVHRMPVGRQVKLCVALFVLWAAAAPAFAQTDSDTNGTGTSHGFTVSDGDTVKFGRQRIRLFGIDAPI